MTDVVLNILPCRADFTRVDGHMHDAGSVTRIAFKYKLTGFRINFSKIDFSVYYFVSVGLFITVGQSTVARQLQKHHFSEITAKIAFNFDCRFFVLEVFSSNNLLSEAVVGLKLFCPKSFRKKFCAFLKAPNFI